MSRSLNRALVGILALALVSVVALTAVAPSPVGAAVTSASQPVTGIAATAGSGGYWQVAADGSVYTSGDAGFHGALPPKLPSAPIVGIARTPDNGGYWLVTAAGGVYTYGDAGFYGSLGWKHLNGQVVAIVPASNGAGYWMVGADGGVFAFGDAVYDGSLPGLRLSVDDVVGAAAYGAGYCLLRETGSADCFAPGHNDQLAPGGAQFRMPYPATAIAADPSGTGYWAVDQHGQVYASGSARYDGSVNITLNAPIIGIASGANDNSYRLATEDGGIFTFGTPYFGHLSVNRSLAPGAAQNAAREMLPWFDDGATVDYPCLVNLWNAESGWRWDAGNPFSGAYGIPQSWPASKMSSAGPNYQTNAFTQLLWGLGYIRSVYGSACAAWAHEQQVGWYRARGLALFSGLGPDDVGANPRAQDLGNHYRAVGLLVLLHNGRQEPAGGQA